MSKGVFKDFSKDDKVVLEFVRYGLCNMACEWAFCYLVEFDYKAKPTAAKAQALADVFLTRGTQTEVNLNNDKLALPVNKKLAGQLDRMKTLATNLSKAKTEPEQLLVLEWAMGFQDVAKPTAIFDETNALCAKGGGDMAGKYNADVNKKTVAEGKVSSDVKNFITKTWEPARKILEKAGLDVKPLEIKPK